MQYIVNNIDKIPPTVPLYLDTYIIDNVLYIKAMGSVDNESGILGFKYKINESKLSDIIDADNYYMYEIHGKVNFNISVTAIDNVLNESNVYEIMYRN